MAWDLTWRVRWKRIEEARVRETAQSVAGNYRDVSVRVEKEEPGTVTCFFAVPWEEEGDDQGTVEVSFYEVAGEVVISLEADAADNDGLWDDAGQLADDLASALDAQQLELE